MEYLGILLFGAWLSIFFLNLFGVFLCLAHLSRSKEKFHPHFEPVTVLKPVKGADPSLKENLQTFFELQYPNYELLISVASSDDPAFPIVKELLEKNPSPHARVLVGEIPLGINPKVNNLARAYDEAQHDWIWISDSNVKVRPNALQQMMSQVDEKTGILTALVAGRDDQSIGATIEAAYLNTFYAKWMMLAARFKRPCVIGKAMIFRKSMARRFGGMQTLSQYLAEDFMAGEASRKLGLKILIANAPAHQVLGSNYSLQDFWSRHVRWGRIRKSQSPLAFFGEIFTQSIPSGFLIFFGTSYSIWALALHFSVWLCGDWLVIRRMSESTPSWRTFFAWLLREGISIPLWGYTLFGSTVQWRGKKLRLLEGGLLESTPSS